MSSTGKRIDEACDLAGLDYQQLSEATGINEWRIGDLVMDRAVPKMPEVVLISQATGLSVSRLSGGQELPTFSPEPSAQEHDGAKVLRQTLLRYLALGDSLRTQQEYGPHLGPEPKCN